MTNNPNEKAIIQPKFKHWLRDSLEKRGWSDRELAARGEIAHSSVARAKDDDEPVGYTVVVAMAKAFGYPSDVLMEMAELLPAKPPETQKTRLLVSIYTNLGNADKEELIHYAEWLRDR